MHNGLHSVLVECNYRQLEVAKRGGNIRVGLEDNLYISKGVKATNEALVEEAKKIMKEYDLVPLTPAEAREKLNLKIIKEVNNEVRSSWNRRNW